MLLGYIQGDEIMLLRWLLICAVGVGAISACSPQPAEESLQSADASPQLTETSAQPAAASVPRTANGRPNLQGIWQAEGNAAADLQAYLASQGSSDSELPYLPAALEQKLANFTNRDTTDPLNNCFFPGVPRLMYMERPYHIFQTDDHVAITFEWTQVFRLIYTGGQPTQYEGIESWMGNSRGRWEGDELIVDINDLNDKTWFDATGNYHSNALHITEHYRMQDADTIEYSVTIEDPNVYSRPWTVTVSLKRRADLARVMEFQCQAEAEELSGDFERDERTWYGATAHEDNVPFDATAGIELPVPVVGADVPRLADGKPNMTGYYLTDAGGANYGLEKRTDSPFLTPRTTGVIVDPVDGSLPYQPWAEAERTAREMAHRGYDDPTAHCFVAGVPRSNYVPSPFYILQPPGYVVILHERMSYRVIPLDGRSHLPEDVRLWMGDSVGHWDGDTLVIETTNFNGKTWLNEVGDVVTHAQTVVENYTMLSASQIEYRATITDPLAYTRPWTIDLNMNRADDELLEVACHEDNGDLFHLKDVRDAYRAQNPEN